MHSGRTVHAYAHRILCVIVGLSLTLFIRTTSFAETGGSMGRYDGLNSTATSSDTSESEDDNFEQALLTSEEVKLNEFNNIFLDTIVYILGGLAGIMMILQLTAFAVCKMYPSWNYLFEKLSFIGITGYEDGWVLPSIKIALLGVLSYLCISGIMKSIISFILGWFVNIIHFN